MTQPVVPDLDALQAFECDRTAVLAYGGAIDAPMMDGWDPDRRYGIDLRLYVDPIHVGNEWDQFPTLQSAIDFALGTASKHIEIQLKEGTHQGLAYIPQGDQQFAITGAGKDKTHIICAIDAEMPGSEYRACFAANFLNSPLSVRSIFENIAAKGKIGTSNASVIRIESPDTHISNLSIQNSYNCDRAAAANGTEQNAAGQFRNGQHQAVALLSMADRLVLESVSLQSFQDTLYLHAPEGMITRASINQCDISGDVDFIFGQATAHFRGCDIHALTSRAPKSWVAAPSTNIRTPFGFVFEACHFSAEPGGRVQLARQWFEGVRASPYNPDLSSRIQLGAASQLLPPNSTISRASLESVGKCLILRSTFSDGFQSENLWGGWCDELEPANQGRFSRHPRFRPVQSSPKDFYALLRSWSAFVPSDYTGLDQDLPWLGVYDCKFFDKDV